MNRIEYCYSPEIIKRIEIIIDYRNSLINALNTTHPNSEKNFYEIRDMIIRKSLEIEDILKSSSYEPYIILRGSAMMRGRDIPQFKINYAKDFIKMVQDEEKSVCIDIIDFYLRLIAYMEKILKENSSLLGISRLTLMILIRSIVNIFIVIIYLPSIVISFVFEAIFGSKDKQGIVLGAFSFFAKIAGYLIIIIPILEKYSLLEVVKKYLNIG
jgi:hypothetical protein